MSKFTPGPWVVDYCRNYDEIVGPKDEAIAQTGAWRDVEKAEQHANARLIAAAPALYEALQAVYRIAGAGGSAHSIYVQIRQEVDAALALVGEQT